MEIGTKVHKIVHEEHKQNFMIEIHTRTWSTTIQRAHRCPTTYIQSLWKFPSLLLLMFFASIQYHIFPFYLFINIDLYPLKSLILWGFSTNSLRNKFSMCGVYKIFLLVHVHSRGEIFTVQWQIKSLLQNKMRNIILSGLCISVLSVNQKTAGNNTQQSSEQKICTFKNNLMFFWMRFLFF